MTRITVDGLVKTFDKFVAVDNVSFNVESGEFFSLLGPSGCGKTTTLYCIAGLEKPTRGRIYFDEQDVTNVHPRKRNVGMVFQSYAVFFNMTVEENIAYPLKVRKVPSEEIKRKVKEMAELLRIEGILKVRADRLTPSQMQLVSLGRALIYEPKILLLDEPLSNLDPSFRFETLREIKRIQRLLKTTTIFVTHDQLEALSASDRIAVMKSGKILQIGTPSEIYKFPKHTFVGGFIGTPPMNLMDGKILKREGRVLATIGDTTTVLHERFVRALPNEMSEVVFGVRPEDVLIADEASREIEGIRLAGHLVLTDRLETENVYAFRSGSMTLKILSNRFFREYQEVQVIIPFNKLYVFDAKTGENVLHPD